MQKREEKRLIKLIFSDKKEIIYYASDKNFNQFINLLGSNFIKKINDTKITYNNFDARSITINKLNNEIIIQLNYTYSIDKSGYSDKITYNL